MNTRQALNQLALVNSYLRGEIVPKILEEPKAKRGRKKGDIDDGQKSLRTLSFNAETEESDKKAQRE